MESDRINGEDIYSQIKKLCGETVFGQSIDHTERAYKFVYTFLKRSLTMNFMNDVSTGPIIMGPPTRQDLVDRLFASCQHEIDHPFSYASIEVTDRWGLYFKPIDIYNTKQRKLWKSGKKRFEAKRLTFSEQITKMVKESRGVLSECFVISFLNTGLKCPECGERGKIAWCQNRGHHDGFRDAICMACHSNNVTTLFEIKTRWNKHSRGNKIYAGSFPAVNTLLSMNANVYIVVASRDTGDVRIGKITSAEMRENRNWFYALQENQWWGNPSSYVYCSGGLFLIPVRMKSLVDTLNDEFLRSIQYEVLQKLDWDKIDRVVFSE